ncbi:hypothetical protein IAU59_006516 [Kwoniella sp. CBS 9459]
MRALSLARPEPTRIPISSLLPPLSSSPQLHAHASTGHDPNPDGSEYPSAGPSKLRYLPYTSYISGPTPRTSPFHLALDYLSRTDQRPRQNFRHQETTFTDLLRDSEKDAYFEEEEGRYTGALDRKGKGKGKEQEQGQATGANRPKQQQQQQQQKRLALPPLEGLRSGERVLIISGSRGDTIDQLVEEDEDWLRSHGGEFDVLQRLRRIDMRYCPTPAHLNLLLTLLSESTERIPTRTTTQAQPQLVPLPSVVILQDIAGLFMVHEEVDENEPPRQAAGPEEEENQVGLGDGMEIDSDAYAGPDGANEVTRERKNTPSRKRFKEGVCLSDYMDLLSAAKAAVDHLSNSHPSEPPVQLILLEPSLTSSSSLPILPPLVSENEDPRMNRTNRERRIKVIDGASWIFGRSAVGIIEPSVMTNAGNGDGDEPPNRLTRYTLLFRDGKDAEAYGMIKRPCRRALTAGRGVEDGFVEGEEHGSWRWEWA